MITMYDDYTSQDAFFEQEQGTLMGDIDPDNIPDGYYYVQACAWRQAYLELEREVDQCHKMSSIFSQGVEQIQDVFTKMQEKNDQKLEVTKELNFKTERENDQLKKELCQAYTQVETRKNKITGPLLAELKISKMLVAQLSGTDCVVRKQMKVLKAIIRTPRMYT